MEQHYTSLLRIKEQLLGKLISPRKISTGNYTPTTNINLTKYEALQGSKLFYHM